jgi:hypothetical protein
MTILAEEPVTIQRRTGAYVDGELTVTGLTTEPLIIGIQPAPGRVMLQLPERARGRETLVGRAAAEQPELRTIGAAGLLADRIVRATGSIYEVQGVADWTQHTDGIPHREYTLVRVGEDEVAL